MKYALRWCIAQRLATLGFGVAIAFPVHAVTVELPLTDLQPQYASQLCWAAADAIAVNSFYAMPCQAGSAAGRTSQAVEAGFNVLDVTTLATLTTLQPANVSNVLSDCETNIQVCNYAGNPILPGLTYKKTLNGAALSWSQAKVQIDGGHPFLFQWNYPSGGGSSKPVGLHELVAIGYSDDNSQQLLIVWDPWPVPRTLPVAVPACDPANTNISSQLKTAHTFTIDFSTYVDPENDMGVAAAHSGDQYDLALPIPDAPVLQIDGAQTLKSPLPKKKRIRRYRHDFGVQFALAMKHALPESLRPTLLKEPRSQSFGIPFPIIGLELEDLRLGSKPQALLTRKTSAVLFPVESHGVVVDALLMLLRDGRWHRGGYANTEITRLLVQARSSYAAKEGLAPETFYVVSVPGRAAFFAAHGRNNHAVLIPASSDPSINVVAEVPIPAAQVFKDLNAAIKRDDSFAAKRPPRS